MRYARCMDEKNDRAGEALQLSVATLHLVRTEFAAAPDFTLTAPGHLLELRVTPRPLNARGCYHAQWGPHRFERLGDMLFVPAGHALHVRGDGAGVQNAIQCLLHGDELTTWLEAEIDWTPQRLRAGLDISSIAIRHLVRRLGAEAAAPGRGSRMLCEFLLGQLIIELGRYFEAIGDEPASGGLAAWRLRLIDERLQDLRNPPTLGELAVLCRISVRQLTRGFRASRGATIGDHIAHTQIETAKRLLDGHNVKSVAAEVGFASPASFMHAFRRSTGLSPLQFRRRVLGAKPEKQQAADAARRGSDGE